MITRSFLLILFVCSFVIAGQSSAGDKLVQIVVDNSGILHDERDPRGKSNFNTFLKTFFNNLARHYRRDRRSTTIRIISAIDPPLTIWSGFASDFSRTGIKSADVLGLVTDRPAGCNNLPAAIEEASINRELINAENNVLHIITSGVHSGPGCSELSQEEYVKLVQQLDQSVIKKIGDVLEKFSAVSLQFLTTTQRRLAAVSLRGASTAPLLYSQGEPPKVEE